MKLLFCMLILSICAISGCGSSMSVTAVWGGTVSYAGSSCDIIQSQPPSIDPTQPYHFKVDLGAATGDPVTVTDSAGRLYQGEMTSSTSFVAYLEEYDWQEVQSGVPPLVEFKDIGPDSAIVIFYFTLDAPHGCTHTYQGEFEKGIDLS